MLFKEYPKLTIPLNKNFKIPVDIGVYRIRRHTPTDILDEEFINQMDLKGLSIREVQLFISPPNYKGTIHVDGHNADSSIGALNFVVTDTNWIMEWFESSQLEISKEISAGRTDYISYKETECKKISEVKFVSPTLIQVGIPHKINNFGNSHRVCISIRFKENNFDGLLKKFDEHFT